HGPPSSWNVRRRSAGARVTGSAPGGGGGTSWFPPSLSPRARQRAPNSPSSVCGARTRTRSHAPITARFISSLRAMTDLAAVLGAVGAAAVLTAGRRLTLLGGFVVVVAAEVVLAHAGGLHISAKLVGAAVVGVAIL